ncbi:MAG: hypothetical protein JWQ27_1132 [Ferruginibacter sp.]|nr:hypothetical protein [Ferruginibacter sp.]
MAFVVKFDSSAIYKTLNPVNQYDINKLYGFTEGTDPHLNSARIGWSWNDHALRLYAYAYKNGERFSKEIAITPLNKEIICKISVAPGQYSFSVDGVTEVLPRAELPVTATGYQLFPYFGGDETAPASIGIFIKEITSASTKI